MSGGLLGQARDILADLDDASLFDRASAGVRVVYRAVDADRSCKACDDLPLDTEDEGGNLADSSMRSELREFPCRGGEKFGGVRFLTRPETR